MIYRYRGFAIQLTARAAGGSFVRWWTPMLNGKGATTFCTSYAPHHLLAFEVAKARVDGQISAEADEVLAAAEKLALPRRDAAAPDSTKKGFRS